MDIVITWQPESAEPGHYFLTIVQHENALDMIGIMAKAFAKEGLDPSQPYELCSVVSVDGPLLVVV